MMSDPKESIVSMVAKLIGRGGVIPTIGSISQPVISFPEWLQIKLDEYAAQREAELLARIEELEAAQQTLPEGWKFKDDDDGEYVLTHPEIGGCVFFPPHDERNVCIAQSVAWYFLRDLMKDANGGEGEDD